MAKTESDIRKHFMHYNDQLGKAPVAFFDVYASDTWTYTLRKMPRKSVRSGLRQRLSRRKLPMTVCSLSTR